MQSKEIRKRFLDFFAKRGHAIIPSASLVPENDPSSLFITAGMQPLVPYLLGVKHPRGERIVDIQKCLRTGDIEDVGDNRHLTFFEMMGNWSLGDYFKEDAIKWSFDFLTNKEEGLGLDPKRFYVTIFRGLPAQVGEEGIPRDLESIKVWVEVFTKLGISSGISDDEIMGEDTRIVALGKEGNFWIAGATGPCGGDTEIFYDVEGGSPLLGNFEDLVRAGRIIEVWNNVFMEFNKTAEGKYEKLATPNVDTGMGLERTAVVMQGKSNVFETDLFGELISYIKNKAVNYDDRGARIIADHLRASVFIVVDGVAPANTEAGYVLRRILRRAIRFIDQLELPRESVADLIKIVIQDFKEFYPDLLEKETEIIEVINREDEKFRSTLFKGLKEFEKIIASGKDIRGHEAFLLFSSYGFPFELTVELAREKNIKVDVMGFEEEYKKHQEISKMGSEQKFKGGMASTGELETKYHTATHLLLAAMREILGPETFQKGSNITAERLRFDFNYSEKLSAEEIKKVEDLVNQKIKENIKVEMVEMPKEQALKIAKVSFDPAKYSEVVKVYKIGDFSAELCGGPHVGATGELGHFKIIKEEASSAGVRRIKAVLE